MTFNEQSEAWIEGLRTRKRSPVKPGSLAVYRSYLKQWVLPRLGFLPVDGFGNARLRGFVTSLSATGNLSPKTINELISVVKAIVASAVDLDGNQLYLRQWNADFVDAPIVDSSAQRTPCASQEQIEASLAPGSSKMAPLFALLAGTGLRVGEARAVRIGEDGLHTCWDPENASVTVRTSLWRSTEHAPKTAAGVRVVDMPNMLNIYLKSQMVGREKLSFMFPGEGKAPVSCTSIYRSMNVAGCHAFRRFRVTHLRGAGAPEEIIRYWVGHAGQSITDRYSKLAQNVEARKVWTERAGLGFNLEVI